jgi:hypothetical protein
MWKRGADLIGVVEAAYRIEQDEDAWLRGVLRAAMPVLDAGRGIVSLTYDASDPSAFRLGTFLSEGLSAQAAAHIANSIPQSDADYVRGAYLSLSSTTLREAPRWSAQPGAQTAGQEFGIYDGLVMNGMNPSGRGCLVMAFLPQITRLSVRRRHVLEKISCHLAAAFRLRLSLASAQARVPTPDVIMDHDGTVHHAEEDARSNVTLANLKRAALAMGNARGSLRVRRPVQAIDEWKGLIAARWTLLEVIEDSGQIFSGTKERAGTDDAAVTHDAGATGGSSGRYWAAQQTHRVQPRYFAFHGASPHRPCGRQNGRALARRSDRRRSISGTIAAPKSGITENTSQNL